MERSETIASLATALAKAQGEIKNPPFDRVNPHYKSRYASISAVRDAITPALSKHGLAVIQIPLNLETGHMAAQTILLHSSGEFISTTFSVPVQKQDAHGYGSALKYCRRYSLESLLCVSGDEDDDGNASLTKPADTAKQEIPQTVKDHDWVDDPAKLAEVKTVVNAHIKKHGLPVTLEIVRKIAGNHVNKSPDIHPKLYGDVIAALTVEVAA